jgi:hypothetical protein
MRNLVFLLSLSLLLGIKAQCQNVDQIVIEKSPPPQGIPICISSCQECGKLIFYSFIAGLKFESQMGNIMEQTIETEVTEYGYQKFTYKVVTRGLPIQNIIIKGPTVSNYDLEVTDLKPATCQYFIVNFRRPDTKGAFLVKTNPSGAKLTIKDEPQFTEVTPFLIKDHVTGNFRIKLEKAGYNTVDTTIIILADKESEISLNLKPLFTAPPPPPPTDQKIIMQNEIKKHGRNQVIWLGSTILAAGTGGYFMIAADKKYKEYLASTDSHANELHKTVVLYDKLGPAFLGLAAVCAVEFTLQTVKKGKDNKQLKLYVNGQGAKFTYNF